jgi:GAF domain-containing protein
MEPAQHELVTALTQLAASVLQEKSLGDDLQRLARLTDRLIRRSTGVSVALLIDGKPSTVAVTDRVTLELDLVQYNTGDGPCLAALGGNQVRVAFLATDERFPHFAAGAADQRVRSVLSTPICYDGRVVGTINIYSDIEDAFSAADADMAAIVATAAANAIAKTELLGQAETIRDLLQIQFDESTIVARAQGVLMAFEECSVEQADALVRSAAEHNAESLIDAALRIIRSAVTDEA